MLTRGRPLALSQIQLVPGDLLILVAIACWSIYSWLLARPPASMRGDARPRWSWAEFLLVQVVFGIAWAAAGAMVESAVLADPDEGGRWGWPLALALLYLATGPSLVAYYAWGTGVASAGPAMAALFSNLTPLLTALISGAVLGSWPEPYHMLAFALIVTGIMFSVHSLPQHEAHHASPQPRAGHVVGRSVAARRLRRHAARYASSIAGEIPPDQALPEVWIADDEQVDVARAAASVAPPTVSGAGMHRLRRADRSGFSQCWRCGRVLD